MAIVEKKGGLKVTSLLIAAFFSFILASCLVDEQKGEYLLGQEFSRIDMSDIDADKKFEWKSVIENVRIIPLETSGESLISRIDKLVFDPKHGIFIMDSRKNPSLIKFGPNGKYKFKLQVGKGPGEFSEIRSFQVSHDTISILERYDLLQYRIDGKYLSKSKIGGVNFLGRYSNPTDFFHSDNGDLKKVYIWTGSLGVRNFTHDVNAMYSLSMGTEIKKYFRLQNHVIGGMRFYKTKENALIVPPIGQDTIFSCSSEGVFPRYYIDFGDNSFSKATVNNPVDALEVNNSLAKFSKKMRYIYTSLITEIGEGLFFHYRNGSDKLGMAFWTKKTGIVAYGNNSLPITVLSSFENELICTVEPIYLKEVLEGISGDDKYLDIPIDKNDNPLLLFLTLKS